MAGTKAGAKKRLATLQKNADEANVDMTSIFAHWGKKGSEVTTGGFQNMDKDKLKEVSKRGVQAREKQRQANNSKGGENGV